MEKEVIKPSTEATPEKKESKKPSTEAKALSLFLMAHKTVKSTYKDHARRMNRLWDLVMANELSNSDYMIEVENMLKFYGGYSAVVEKTVKFYIDKTGEWKLKGDDKYCQDAKIVADKMLKK